MPSVPGMQDYDPQTFDGLKWVLADPGMRDLGFHFEDVGQKEKVRDVLCVCVSSFCCRFAFAQLVRCALLRAFFDRSFVGSIVTFRRCWCRSTVYTDSAKKKSRLRVQ